MADNLRPLFGDDNAPQTPITRIITDKLVIIANNDNQATFRSIGSNRANILIDTSAASQQATVMFGDVSTDKWQVGKAVDNTFFVYDVANTKNVMVVSGGDVFVSPVSGRVVVGTDAAFTAGDALQVDGVTLSKASGKAGIALDPNAATGDYTLSLSPANLTAARRATFPNKDGTVAMTTDVAAQTGQGAGVYHDAAQAVGSGAWAALAMNSERWDTDTCHDNVTNNSRLTATTAGVYSITGTIEFAANSTGVRGIMVYLNGTTMLAVHLTGNNGASVTTNLSIARVYKLAATDYVQLCAYQSSGGDLNVNSVGNYTPEFAMVRISP